MKFNNKKSVSLSFIAIVIIAVLFLNIPSLAESGIENSDVSDVKTKDWSKKAGEFLKKLKNKKSSPAEIGNPTDKQITASNNKPNITNTSTKIQKQKK